MNDGAVAMMQRYNGMDASERNVLNLGCGEDYVDGAVNVDVEPGVNPDEVVDLDSVPWPWENNRFNVVLARHVLEHLSDPMAALEEIQRVTVAGGTLILAYPIGHTRFEDPTHEHYWNYRTAAWIGGDGEHMQENPLGFRLADRRVNVSVGGLTGAYIQIKRRLLGDGAWLSQTPGMCGEVEARYRVEA